jgi:hypothetical protein
MWTSVICSSFSSATSRWSGIIRCRAKGASTSSVHFARSGGWPGRVVHRRRCLRSGRRLQAGRCPSSRGVRHRPPTIQRRAKRHSRDGAHDAGPAPAGHCRAGPHGLAKNLRLRPARSGGGRHQSPQTGHRGWATLPHRPASSDRGCDCRRRTEPDARTRAPGIRPPHVIEIKRGYCLHRRPPADPCNTVLTNMTCPWEQ